MNRRTFLKTASVVTAASLLGDKVSWAAGSHRLDKIGVQLYTLRDLAKADFEGTIAKVAKIGYKEVEFAGYYGRTPKQVRAILEKNALKSPACHVKYEELPKDKWPAQLESAKIIGQSYLVNPWIPEERRKTLDDYKRVADVFNRVGEASQKEGIQFAYHNHWFEFQPLDGRLPYDWLLELCDAKLVQMELDLCWITVGGADPVKYFEKYPGRFPLVHVKDIKTMPRTLEHNPQKILADVGKGIIDWKRIFSKAQKAGIKHYFVEHDAPDTPLESIKTSYEFLRKLRF